MRVVVPETPGPCEPVLSDGPFLVPVARGKSRVPGGLNYTLCDEAGFEVGADFLY